MIKTLIMIFLGVSLLIWLVGAGVFVYHILSFGVKGDATRKGLCCFALVSLFILICGYIAILNKINWNSL